MCIRDSYIHSAVAVSMRYRGLFDARPEDWVGFGLTWIDMSSHYARNQRYMNQISGATDYNDPEMCIRDRLLSSPWRWTP